jgi:hypothetical protein
MNAHLHDLLFVLLNVRMKMIITLEFRHLTLAGVEGQDK